MKRRAAGLLLAPLILLAGCALPSASAAPGGAPVACTGDAVAGLTAEQSSNARAIVSVALGLGLARQGALVGVTAADTESDLQNITYGDMGANGQMTSSRGLFQMKDAWGPLADRLDPVKASTLFYTVDKGAGVRGLTHIPGWQSMTVPQAAQAVEGSQFSDGSNYAAKLPLATAAVDAIIPGCAPAAIPGGGLAQNPSQDPSSFGWVRGAGVYEDQRPLTG